ncbi:uncharacterized protein LOC144624381 [Crassostrea virginica]
MDLRSIGSEVTVKLCSQCQEGTEFYCHSCHQDLCCQCKEKHVIDLDSKHHDVRIYRERFSYYPKQEYCKTHPEQVFKKYCKRCDLPVCYHCRKHRNHELVNIKIAYEDKKQQIKEIIHNIRSDAIYDRRVLLEELRITKDLKKESETCHKKFSNLSSEMKVKSQRLQLILDSALRKGLLYIFFHTDFTVNITNILHSEHGYNQSVYSPVKFLRFIKKADLSSIQESTNFAIHCWPPSLPQEIKWVDLIGFLCEIRILQKGHRQAAKDRLLKLMPTPVFQKSIKLGHFFGSDFSFVSTKLIWVHDGHNLILKETTTGENIHLVDDSCRSEGTNTLTREGELIYVDKNYNINILKKNRQTKTAFIERTCSTWEPMSLYCSPFNGDLLVGMGIPDTYPNPGTGKVLRYNSCGQLTQTIQYDNTGQPLYGIPYIVTENNNGDVVVVERKTTWEKIKLGNTGNRNAQRKKPIRTVQQNSNLSGVYNNRATNTDQNYKEICAPLFVPNIKFKECSVVVTDRRGRHRFKHTVPYTADKFHVRGLCTDALSHIIVNTKNVLYMLDKDGTFLRGLLYGPSVLNYPKWLNYDFNTNLLVVSSGPWYITEEFSVYRYINRNFDLRDPHPFLARDFQPYYGKMHKHPNCVREPSDRHNSAFKTMIPRCPECVRDLQASGEDWLIDLYSIK